MAVFNIFDIVCLFCIVVLCARIKVKYWARELVNASVGNINEYFLDVGILEYNVASIQGSKGWCKG
jgi:hypothetical protein